MLLVAGYAAAAPANFPRHIPLPDDLATAPPPVSAPPEIAAFWGTWVGSWPDSADVVLVIEEFIRPRGIKLVYAWGPTPRQPGRWERRDVEVGGDGTIRIEWPSGANVTLTPRGDTIHAAWERGFRRNETILRRLP